MPSLVIYLLGAFVRVWLSTSEYRNVIANRLEISTPLNSWKRVTEGLYLLDLNVYPYLGDTLHESPLHLLAYNYLTKNCGDYLYVVFVCCDLFTSYLLYMCAQKYIKHLQKIQERNKDKYPKDAKDLLLTDRDFAISPQYVAVAYLFNPFTVLNCVSFTTTVFGNLFMAAFLVGLSYSNVLLSALSLAICISQSFYPVIMLSPLFLQLIMTKNSKMKATFAILLTITFWTIITYLSYLLYGCWDFMESTYGFILTVPDLHPNIGLFWYFFIEMFEHFRNLFIFSFQINATILYLIPLSIRFRKDPMLLATCLLSVTAIFKSYPCLGDVGFVLSVYPCWRHLFNYVQQGFLVSCCFLVTTVLGPTVWYLWIYSGSANANFYFGVTLAFATAQIFLITDILFSYTKREFSLKYGRTRKLNSKIAQLKLEN